MNIILQPVSAYGCRQVRHSNILYCLIFDVHILSLFIGSMNLNLLWGFLPAGLILRDSIQYFSQILKRKTLIRFSFSGFVFVWKRLPRDCLVWYFRVVVTLILFQSWNIWLLNTRAFMQHTNIMPWCTKDDDVKTECWHWGIKEMKMQSNYVGKKLQLIEHEFFQDGENC